MIPRLSHAGIIFATLISLTGLAGCVGDPPQKAHTTDELSERARALLDEAEKDLFLYRFEDSIQKADEVLAIHPDSREALNMVFRARLAQLDNEAFVLERERDMAVAKANRDALATTLMPEEKPMLDRSLIQMRPGITEEEALKVREKLEKKVPQMDLLEADLDEVLYKIFADVEINIALDPGNFAGKKLTIRGKEMTVRYLLENIARTQGLSFTVDDENVWIVSADNPIFISRAYRLNNGLTRMDTSGGYEGLGTLGFLGQTTQSGRGGGFGGGGGAGGGGIGGAGGGGFGGGFGGGAGRGGQDKTKSHLENLVEKIPELVPSWPEGSLLYFDKKQNLVLIKSTRETIEEVDKIIKLVDEVPKQVSIEARFVQIEGEDNFDFGVGWEFENFNALGEDVAVPDFISQGGLEQDVEGNYFVANPNNVVPNRFQDLTGTEFNVPNNLDATTAASLGTSQISLKGVFRDRPFTALLTAIERTSYSTMVSRPSVTVANNNTATIGVTRNLPFIEDYDVETPTTGVSSGFGGNNVFSTTPVVTANINDENFEGRALIVTPSVGADGKTITLYIQPVVRAQVASITIQDTVLIGGGTTTPAIVRPILETKFITTQVSVQDGDTVIIGGLITDEETDQEAKVPILGDLPFLGTLFKRTTKISQKVNLYIFITVRIVSPQGQYYQ